MCIRNCVKGFSFSLFLRLKAGVTDTAGTWDTRYIHIERGASPSWIWSCFLIWLICHFTYVLLYETSLNSTIHSTTVTQPREKSHRATYPRNSHLQVISLQVWHFYTIFLISGRLISRNIYFLSRNGILALIKVSKSTYGRSFVFLYTLEGTR